MHYVCENCYRHVYPLRMILKAIERGIAYLIVVAIW